MNIQKIVVVGAGIMGRGIAHVSAVADFNTILYDISEDVLISAVESIRENLQKAVSRGLLAAERSAEALKHLQTSTDLPASLDGAQFVIEAVPEKIDLKTKLFSEIDARVEKATILASNTSSLSITEMAAVVDRPDQFIGMHFFNPVHKMKLVEIVRGLETDGATIEITRQVAERMGKQTVVIKESPGFITSRINAMIGNEAFYMLQEGIATAEDIDKAVKLGLNHPMGPFEMVDLVGLDTRLSILKFLHQTLGEKYRPCPLLEQYVKAGRLGRKSGKGVFDYTTE